MANLSHDARMQRQRREVQMSEELESIRVLTRSQTLKVVGLSDRTWDRLEARGETPPKTRISECRIGYRLIDIKSWLDRRREVAA
jgi:predicted DNA-binding transcriptional regulator AlpA